MFFLVMSLFVIGGWHFVKGIGEFKKEIKQQKKSHTLMPKEKIDFDDWVTAHGRTGDINVLINEYLDYFKSKDMVWVPGEDLMLDELMEVVDFFTEEFIAELDTGEGSHFQMVGNLMNHNILQPYMS